MVIERNMSARGKAYLVLGFVGVIVILGTLKFSKSRDEWEDEGWDDEEFDIEDSMEKEDETVYTKDPFTTDYIFKSLQEILETPGGKKNASKVEVVIKIVITAQNEKKKLWILDLATSDPKVYTATSAKGVKHDCQVNVADSDLFKISRGRLHVQSAFLSGKMKIYGNILRAAKIKDILAMALQHDYKKRVAEYHERKAKNNALKNKLDKMADAANPNAGAAAPPVNAEKTAEKEE